MKAYKVTPGKHRCLCSFRKAAELPETEVRPRKRLFMMAVAMFSFHFVHSPIKPEVNNMQSKAVFHLENCPRGEGGGATGGIWILRGAWWLKMWQSSTNAIWGFGVCLNVCMCRVSYRILSFQRGEVQSSVLTWKGCTAHNNKEDRGHAPPD